MEKRECIDRINQLVTILNEGVTQKIHSIYRIDLSCIDRTMIPKSFRNPSYGEKYRQKALEIR